MKKQLTIVKVGGAVVEDDAQLTRLVQGFAAISGRKMLVHGGGRKATKMAERLGIETRMINGRRVTNADMLEVVTMVYGGLVNKNIVARLQACGINAIGLTGADGNIISSQRRKPTVVDGQTVDYGYVGDIDRVAHMTLGKLIEDDLIPVVAPLTHDCLGGLLNTNADTIASKTAEAMAHDYEVTLIFAFEKPGVLANPDDDSTVIPVITHDLFDRYKADGTISGGMLPKIENALAAVDAGVSRVVITRADAIDGCHGTVIRKTVNT